MTGTDPKPPRLCRCIAAGTRCRHELTGTGAYCAFCTAWGCEERDNGTAQSAALDASSADHLRALGGQQ